jgi:hypothetical protein
MWWRILGLRRSGGTVTLNCMTDAFGYYNWEGGFGFVRIDWRRIASLLLRSLIVLILLAPIAFLFSIDLKFVLISVIVLLGLWEKRDKLLSILGRAKVIVGVLLGTSVLLGSVLWWTTGKPDGFITLVLGTIFAMILTLGLGD